MQSDADIFSLIAECHLAIQPNHPDLVDVLHAPQIAKDMADQLWIVVQECVVKPSKRHLTKLLRMMGDLVFEVTPISQIGGYSQSTQDEQDRQTQPQCDFNPQRVGSAGCR